jgi:hypothetical protein
MFWINFEWLCFVDPPSLEADGDTIKLNKVSLALWRSMPKKYRGWAITLDIMLEGK